MKRNGAAIDIMSARPRLGRAETTAASSHSKGRMMYPMIVTTLAARIPEKKLGIVHINHLIAKPGLVIYVYFLLDRIEAARSCGHLPLPSCSSAPG